MAKEYFQFQNDHFEFDDETFTMTMVGDNTQGKSISVTNLTELQFMSQLYSFRANVLRGQAVAEESSMMMSTNSQASPNALMGPQFENSSEETFLATKSSALAFIT
ncbi:MAG: hypothetical protein RLZZ196_2430, partial [Bacteroidota bacterium]